MKEKTRQEKIDALYGRMRSITDIADDSREVLEENGWAGYKYMAIELFSQLEIRDELIQEFEFLNWEREAR